LQDLIQIDVQDELYDTSMQISASALSGHNTKKGDGFFATTFCLLTQGFYCLMICVDLVTLLFTTTFTK